MEFLPVKKEELLNDKGEYTGVDFVLISADAYVDHPSFANALIGRLVQSLGYSVGIIPQPNWNKDGDFKKFGKPRLGFLVSGGNIDSMVNNYSVSLHKRKVDEYSCGGKVGKRPDRPTIVYSKKIKEIYPDSTVIIGGIEASLRRFAHYDYWEDTVRPSILVESGADILIYGMGEKPLKELCFNLDNGIETFVRGCCYLKEDIAKFETGLIMPSFEMVRDYKSRYNAAFKMVYDQQNSPKSPVLIQPHGIEYVVQMPPSIPLKTQEMDEIYDLPFTRRQHPMYQEKIPAIEEVEHSITAHRGCYGGCAFCSLIFHQGRIIQNRSNDSIVREAELIAKQESFKGYIHDVGGPSANFHTPACKRQEMGDICKDRHCLFPTPCKNLKVDHTKWLDALKQAREVDGVKKVFVKSGIRFDYLMLDKDKKVLGELVENHISGQLKIAPEHVSNEVLKYMGKPCNEQYLKFCDLYDRENRAKGKDQYIVPYFMSSHPGCNLKDAIELAMYLKEHKLRPLQVQDFYPTPGTLATCMYYTGVNPIDGEKVFVARDKEQKAMQRALMQYFLPQNKNLILKALKIAKREDLIGKLVPGERMVTQGDNKPYTKHKTNKKVKKKTK